jgi:DNA mismatch endonuclease (patch repair protein)
LIVLREPRRPAPTSPERSRIMRAVRRQATGPERRLQEALRSLGLRFATNARDLPGSPDIVFRRQRVAVIVHGCFWHRHRNCPRTTTPRSNVDYWHAKFAANVDRDRRKLAELRRLGWKAIVLWQCEIEADPLKAAQRVFSILAPEGKVSRPRSRQSSSRPGRSR